jgi:hypothetical protein
MLKRLPVLLCVFFALSFRAWPQEPPGHWVTLPADGVLTVIGVSGRRLRRDWEIAGAREDAAYKALLYRGLQGNMRVIETGKAGPDGARPGAEISLEPLFPGELPALREALRFDPEQDVWRSGSAVFVRFSCPAPGAERPDYSPGAVVTSGEPEWTRRPPLIAGYTTAAGFAGPRRSIRETVGKSCEDAAAGIIAARSITVRVFDSVSGGGGTSYTAATAEGELQGFVVLEMWIDPKTRAVWTLAAARKTP